jgi:arsenite-transporting ATPase
MRILLFTGKGGVGKTTVAAATATRAAENGLRTIVLSTDPAHSLADAFDVPLGDRPTPIAHRLFGQQLNARVRFEEAWEDVRTYLVDVLDWAGADAVEAEELAVIPGLDEVFALADIKEFATNGEYDLVVVDCAPTAETIRLLSLPDVLGWYMERMFDTQRRLTRLARPILQRVSGIPIAGDGVFGAVRRFYERLDGVRELLTDGDITSARLVVNPERLVIAEARRTFTYLSLFGYHVDAVIANRIYPSELDHPWLTRSHPCRFSRPSSQTRRSLACRRCRSSPRTCTATPMSRRGSRTPSRFGSRWRVTRCSCRCSCRSPSATTFSSAAPTMSWS